MPASANQNLTITFGENTYEVAPPPAAVGYFATFLMEETNAARAADRPVDEAKIEQLADELGIKAATMNDITELMLGRDLMMRMLRELNVDQMDQVTNALGMWVMGGRKAAEDFLADPTPDDAPTKKAPQDHKPSTRKQAASSA